MILFRKITNIVIPFKECILSCQRGELEEVENRLKNLSIAKCYYGHSKTAVLSKRCYLVRKKEILIFICRVRLAS